MMYKRLKNENNLGLLISGKGGYQPIMHLEGIEQIFGTLLGTFI